MRGRAPELPAPVAVAGVEFEPVTRWQAATLVADLATGDAPALVVTPNVDHVVMLRQDADFRAAYDSARLRLCDGAPLFVLARLCGHDVPQRVTGADLFGDACRVAAERGLSVFVVGGAPEVNERALAVLRRALPTLRITGVSPPMHFEGTRDDELVQQRIAEERPDIVMVCMGAPRSEIWAAELQRRHPAVYVCVGAAIDFVAGSRQRAPRWMQRVGVEWVFRLAQEPRRLWRRYLVRDSVFAVIALRELAGAYRRSRAERVLARAR